MIQNICGIRYSKVLLGIAILLILFIFSAYVYLRFGPVPVAVADPAFPFEKPTVRIAVRSRTARENQTLLLLPVKM
jgi:thiosulfate dehydrogenase